MRVDTNELWWWCPARRQTMCDRCGQEMASGERMCFHPASERCLCGICAEGEGVAADANPSLAWRQIEAEQLNATRRSTT